MLGERAQVRSDWVASELLVSSAVLAEAWRCSTQDLDEAEAQGEIFCILVGAGRFYPRDFTRLDAVAVKAVCQRLQGTDAVAKFVFWSKCHGLLDGLTIADAIAAGNLPTAARLAKDWSGERGLPR